MSSAGVAVDITSQRPSTDLPRSRRVGMVSPPSGFNIDSFEADATPSSPPASPPLLPVRSPLRPMARSISGTSATTAATVSTSTRPLRFRRPTTPPPLDIDDYASIVEDPIPLTFQMRHRSLQMLGGLGVDTNAEDLHMSKALPLRPDSPVCLSIEDEATTSSSSSSLAQQPPLTKRQHALHELLSSERAYASDLALIREVHIPLALGQPVPLNATSPSPPPPLSSSSSSSRTLSMSSDSSSASFAPPMTPEDTRIIFSNITELAIFSDQLCDGLEEALGSTVEGGEGEDHVGALFLDIIPELERPYKFYINKHPAALAHLQALPQTPALAAYLAHTQTVASHLSHAWDLSSLLIKPVQRLLKYSLLLAAIIDETPDTHGDKENLKQARLKMEEVARNVNEGRRRAEVVKEVLTAKKKPVNVGVAASVNLTKIKSLRKPAHVDPNGEAALVEKMQAELKRIDVFAQQFAKNVLEWARTMGNVVASLRVWAASFGKVIGLSLENGSEAFDAFMALVETQLLPLCHRLEAEINERLLKEIAHLLMTMNQPLKLLASMDEQAPFHYHLLTMNVSAKNRPPATLLSASTNYLALRGQLAAELPSYLVLLHRGLSIFVQRLAQIQASFWGDVRDRWADLWEMLRVEGEMNAGHEETTAVWQARWADVDEIMASLNINQARKLYQEPPASKMNNVSSMLASLDPPHVQPYGRGSAPTVVGMLSSLEPVHVMNQYAVSSPLPLARSTRPRSRGQSDASTTVALSKKSSVGRKISNDSLPSTSTAKASKKKSADGFMDFVAALPISPPSQQQKSSSSQQAIPRTKSMPIPTERTISHRSSTSSKTLVGGDGDTSLYLSQELPDETTITGDRGRTSRKPSLRRKFTDSLRTPARQRSTSKSNTPAAQNHNPPTFFDDLDAPPTPPPPAGGFNQHTHRDSWVTRRAKYVCRVVHACRPPSAVSYFSFPFFTLVEGDLYEVLQEAGHPSIHPKLPLYVDDGEDCLLLCRDDSGNVGWALASFLAPLEGLSFS